jgi:uncharacterized protein
MSHRRALIRMVLAACLMLSFSRAAGAGEITLTDTAFNVPVKSMKELRELRTVHQDYDFSCGSASVATLLTFSYDIPTSEHDVFDTMYAVGDQEHIKQYGFSLLDMQKYLASRGLHTVGYKMSLEKLRRLHIPAIVLINPNGYNHFVVVRGWRNNAAIVADPRLGLRRMPAEDFQAVCNGIVFLIKDYHDVAERHYNDPEDFKLIPRSSVHDSGFYANQGLADFLINIPIFNEF